MIDIPLFKVRMAEGAQRRVAEVLASGYIGQGAVCEEFERQFGRLVGALDPPLLVNSCTSAIDLALHLLDIPPHQGRYVISTPITCTATNSPPALRGLPILWADVDPLTGNIDPRSVERIIAQGYDVRAIIAVNWGGRPFDPALLDIAIPLIEDAAHGPFGGNYGDYVCWSFQAIKHLTTGDGGALWCPDLERARLLRWYGLDRRSKADFRCEQDIAEIGHKYQSNDIAAAIGLANLQAAEWSVARSRQNAEWYTRVLAGVPFVTLPPFDPGASYWIFTILVDDRASFSTFLRDRGIATSQVHARNDKHTAFKAAAESPVPLPGVDDFDAHQVAIPNGWWVGEEERQHIAAAIYDWAEQRGRRAA
jgi:dTDP-4-amino-4,6-dideoxygalactose transaminase